MKRLLDALPARAIALVAGLSAVALALSCSGGRGATPAAAPTSVVSPSPAATPVPTAVPTSPSVATEPRGFPIDPTMRLGLVVGTLGQRTIEWGVGPDALSYSRDDQPSNDPERADRDGWNCRVHVEYEGQPAVDWYVAVGTPVRATMDGTATLNIVTVTNAFDFYGVDGEPYLGNPDRSRAPVSPFPGVGGGKGVFVQVENDAFVTDYGHLDPSLTLVVVQPSAFIAGYDPDSDYATLFAPLRDFRVFTPVARWSVRRGDVIGFSGDSGYSEAPHLHYTVNRAGDASLLCPTAEAGFQDGGWLLR